MTKQNIYDFIDQHQAEYTEISHKIWDFAELSLKEYKSAALYVEKLKKDGFVVEENLGNIPTAFKGTYTEGPAPGTEGAGPVIGILAEFDALSGLSQKAQSLKREFPEESLAREQNGSGHGCGHNMLGAGSYAAAHAVKEWLMETKTPGTVIFYGCPGEEGGASKAFLAREGVWKALDAALTWHPGDYNTVVTGTCNSCIQKLYKFKGVAAHAAGNPYDGRSALDAIEIMNIGCQYLREHMKDDCRIHYSMIDGGGVSPNVVQPHASVLYMIRATKVKDTVDLAKRVDLLAEGAAKMTETTYETIFVDGTCTTLPNTTLEKVMYENLISAPAPVYTEEEEEFAKKLKETYPVSDEVPGPGAKKDPAIKAFVQKGIENGKKALPTFVYPFYSGDDFMPGSTDVGDVSYLTPTAQLYTVTYPFGAPGHSWQNVSCGRTSIGDKGLLYAGKAIAGACVDLFENPKLLKEAKKEFKKRTKNDKYVCPVPKGAEPYVIEE